MIGYAPNKCSKVLVAISQKFDCRKEACGYAKVIQKKRKRKRDGKNGQVSEILKTMGTQMSAWKEKKEMNKIAPVLLQKYF